MTASAAMSFEIDSDVAIEYGLNLPHSGEEPAWFAENAEALSDISGTSLWREDRVRGTRPQARTIRRASCGIWSPTPAGNAHSYGWRRARLGARGQLNRMFVRWRFSNHTRD
jgi:hypothetical protein